MHYPYQGENFSELSSWKHTLKEGLFFYLDFMMSKRGQNVKWNEHFSVFEIGRLGFPILLRNNVKIADMPKFADFESKFTQSSREKLTEWPRYSATHK